MYELNKVSLPTRTGKTKTEYAISLGGTVVYSYARKKDALFTIQLLNQKENDNVKSECTQDGSDTNLVHDCGYERQETSCGSSTGRESDCDGAEAGAVDDSSSGSEAATGLSAEDLPRLANEESAPRERLAGLADRLRKTGAEIRAGEESIRAGEERFRISSERARIASQEAEEATKRLRESTRRVVISSLNVAAAAQGFESYEEYEQRRKASTRKLNGDAIDDGRTDLGGFDGTTVDI
jgi:hypothetical protein